MFIIMINYRIQTIKLGNLYLPICLKDSMLSEKLGLPEYHRTRSDCFGLEGYEIELTRFGFLILINRILIVHLDFILSLPRKDSSFLLDLALLSCSHVFEFCLSLIEGNYSSELWDHRCILDQRKWV